MASYHLDVKSVQRSAGRSATAAAAYRHAARIECHREGRVHDYTRKQGVEDSFIVAPEDAPAWVHDREALWNAAEERDTRINSVTAREWELALPAELDAAGRRELAHGFARELVTRYQVAADVAIHAPHREGDQRNWHAHVLTTTRRLEAQGLTAKTRELDAQQTRGAEVKHMREHWAEMQNQALERQGHEARVSHRTLHAQREEALSRGQAQRAEELDRAAEVKLGPVAGAIERREQRAAERESREYVPVTERGALVHEARRARELLHELGQVRDRLRQQVYERLEAARQGYGQAREEGATPVRAGLTALRAAVQRQGLEGPGQGLTHGQGLGREVEERATAEAIRDGLARLRAQEAAQTPGPGRERGPGHGPEGVRERLERLRERTQAPAREAEGESIEGRLARLLGHEQRHEREKEREQGQGLRDVRERLERLREREESRTLERTREELSAALERARQTAHAAREEPRHDQAHDRDGEAHRQGQRHRERGHEDDGHGWGL